MAKRSQGKAPRKDGKADSTAKAAGTAAVSLATEAASPATEAPPAAQSAAGPEADDLTRIKGIGPATARALVEADITTFAQLAATEEPTAPSLNSLESAEEWASWREQAAELASEDALMRLEERPDAPRERPEAGAGDDEPAGNSAGPASNDPPDPPKTRAVLVVRTRKGHAARRRAGLDFGPQESVLNAADFSAEQIAAIEADPVLIAKREERPV